MHALEQGLAALLAPMSVEEFMRDHHGRAVLHRRGRADRFADLLRFRDLDEILRSHRLSAPRLRLSKGGRTLPEASYTRTVDTLRGPYRQLSVERLLAELRGGATLVLDAIDEAHPPLRPLRRALDRELDAFVWINTYVSWGATNGFPYHWDDHDTYVLQIFGRKRWHVHPPTRPWPLARDVEVHHKPDEFGDEILLEPGDLLYVPRGFWHVVMPVDEPTIHLTIGVIRPTGADFLAWLLHRVKAADPVRQDVPLAMGAAERAAYAARLREVLAEALQPDAVEAFRRSLADQHALDPAPTLEAVHLADPATWSGDAHAVLLATRAEVVERGASAVLALAGAEHAAPNAAAPLLRALADGRAVRVDALRADLPAALLADLVDRGLLAIR